MTAAKPTPGPWEAGTRYRGSYVVWGPDRANEDYFVSIHEGPDAGKNARLTAEAGTVYHETGLTPRQLAEQRAELLEALGEAQYFIHSVRCRNEKRGEAKRAVFGKITRTLARAKGESDGQG